MIFSQRVCSRPLSLFSNIYSDAMDSEFKKHLKSLADKYENKEFLIGDPSWFMHQVEGDSNKELLAFIASSISYGSRKQFLPKIQYLLDSITSQWNNKENATMPSDLVSKWLTEGKFKMSVPDNDDCFYRLYTNHIFHIFLSSLADIIHKHGSLKEFIRQGVTTSDATNAIELITSEFSKRSSIGVIPKNTNSSCKRICMFLRWMVRDDSPVDLGLWSDILDKKTLIIPMDTHVVQEANRLGLISGKSTSMKSAIKLTSKLKEIFPNDPLKGDFALFGLGVDAE